MLFREKKKKGVGAGGEGNRPCQECSHSLLVAYQPAELTDISLTANVTHICLHEI